MVERVGMLEKALDAAGLLRPMKGKKGGKQKGGKKKGKGMSEEEAEA